MYDILKNTHSGWRYVVLILLIIAVVKALSGWMGNKAYTEGDRKINLLTLISVHIQLLMGLVLYFISPLTKGPMSDPSFRYWKVEHISMMVIAAILITIGNAKSKKGIDGVAKHRSISLFFGIALIIIIVAILLMTKSVPGTTFFGIS